MCTVDNGHLNAAGFIHNEQRIERVEGLIRSLLGNFPLTALLWSNQACIYAFIRAHLLYINSLILYIHVYAVTGRYVFICCV